MIISYINFLHQIVLNKWLEENCTGISYIFFQYNFHGKSFKMADEYIHINVQRNIAGNNNNGSTLTLSNISM